MKTVHAYAAMTEKSPLVPYEYTLGELGQDQVDIKVEYCGICHSDLSMLHNDWGMTQYPFVGGHEVVGVVEEVGKDVKTLKVGQRVGLGWYSHSCMHCHSCLSGDQNLCSSAEGTIVGRFGGFANLVRANVEWVIPLPKSLDAKNAGPLFCGGITVFNPLVQFDVRPTQRVGVIGIGGLGHLAIQFLNKWGCEVTAFTSTPSKDAEIKKMGAHVVVNSGDSEALANLAGRFDFIINTVNVPLDWNAYMAALAPRGRLHTVGAIPEPMDIVAFPMISGQRSISGSPLGSPATIGDMLAFCERHQIAPVTEEFKMTDINQAIEHLHSGKARYRVVLKA